MIVCLWKKLACLPCVRERFLAVDFHNVAIIVDADQMLDQSHISQDVVHEEEEM